MTTFTRQRPGVLDPTTGRYSDPSSLTIAGEAIQVRGSTERLKALSLTESLAPTLFFTPTEYGLRAHTDDFVKPDDTVIWNDAVFTVRDVQPVAPDGIVIAARIVVSK